MEVGEVLVTLDVGGTVFVTTAETLRRAGRLGDFVGSVLEGLRGSAGERVENEEERAVELEMESAEGDEESEGHFSFTVRTTYSFILFAGTDVSILELRRITLGRPLFSKQPIRPVL
jgi:hypothetical protein